METSESKDYVELVYDVYDGTDDDMLVAALPPIVILHGILDNKENWTQIAKEIADKSVRKVFVPDLRNHGDSPKTEIMTFQDIVKDVEYLLKKINEPVVLIGHSLGGIIAIDLAFKKSHLLKELILIDISPMRYPKMEEEFGCYMCSILKNILTNISPEDFFKDKSIVENRLKGIIKIPSLRKIIVSNITQVNDQLMWRANIDVLELEFAQKRPFKKVYPLRGSYGGNTLLIHGDSDYVIESDLKGMPNVFPKLDVVYLKDRSHWIQMDEPDQLVKIIVQFLSNNP